MATAVLLLAAASLTNAHFGVDYPPMRASTLGADKDERYSQWTNPCAGVPGNLSTTPQTPWPLTGGGSIKLDLRHPWEYVFINLGLGDDVGNFNYTLTEPFWNVTGNGTLCIPQLALPADLPVADGSPASLQVVTVGADGNALYNCADIVFRADAAPFGGDECVTSEGVTFAPVGAAAQAGGGGDGDGDGGEGSGGDGGEGTGSDESAAAATGVNRVALSSVVALAVVFVFGLSV